MMDKTIHFPPPPNEEIHVPSLTAALAFALAGGLVLAVTLPLEVVSGAAGASWVARGQVHGHLQAVGFAGLFVVGMSLRLAPRFGGREVMALDAMRPSMLALLVGGLLARAIGQLLADARAFAVVATLGALAEAAAGVLFLAMMAATLRDGLRAGRAPALLLAGAALGLAAQGLLGLWWAAPAFADGLTVLPAAEHQVLVDLRLYGVLLPAIIGVGLRSFPAFFGRTPPSLPAGRAVAAATLAGAVLWTMGGLLRAGDAEGARACALAGQALTGAGILGAIAALRPWRPPTSEGTRGLERAVRPAVAWLALTGLLLCATAARAAVAGGDMSATTADAVRHVFAVGVVTLAIVGMAQLILPEFASERQVGAPGAWRSPFFGATLSVAVALRSLVPLAGLEGDARWWAMAVAGTLAWLAVAVFAWLWRRALRCHRGYLARLALEHAAVASPVRQA